jgi:hypothetical protein
VPECLKRLLLQRTSWFQSLLTCNIEMCVALDLSFLQMQTSLLNHLKAYAFTGICPTKHNQFKQISKSESFRAWIKVEYNISEKWILDRMGWYGLD